MKIMGIGIAMVALIGLGIYSNHARYQNRTKIVHNAEVIKQQEVVPNAVDITEILEKDVATTPNGIEYQSEYNGESEDLTSNLTALADENGSNSNNEPERVVEKVWVDSPASNTSQTQDSSASHTPMARQTQSAAEQILDKKVNDAIAARDFREARTWALTAEHWRKIDEAEKSNEIQISKSHDASNARFEEQPQNLEIQIQQNNQYNKRVVQQTQQQSTEQPPQKQIELQQLQQKIQQETTQRQQELAKLQQQVSERQQQAQHRQDERQACLNRLRNQPQNQPAAMKHSIEQAGSSAASMQTLRAQNFARDSALCN